AAPPWAADRRCTGRGRHGPKAVHQRGATPMTHLRVKICGITSLDDALWAVEAGADAIGFIFVEGTPRYVTPAAAAAIVAELPPFVCPVGVFWDHAPAHVAAVVAECGLGALQLHGEEPPEVVAA